jgi:soluble lytic murein transglycosylase-like protein
MRPFLKSVCAILAVPVCLIVSASDVSSLSALPALEGLPRPEEIALLEELAAWEWAERQEAADRELATALLSRGGYLAGPSHRQLVSSLPYGQVILETASRHGLDSLLLAAVIETESSFDAGAISPQGAVGLMQLLPTTAKSLGIIDPEDPRRNLEAGSRYLQSLLGRFDGDLGLALAAYNAGPTTVARYGDVPPYPETLRYVRRVLRLYLTHHRSAWSVMANGAIAVGRDL